MAISYVLMATEDSDSNLEDSGGRLAAETGKEAGRRASVDQVMENQLPAFRFGLLKDLP